MKYFTLILGLLILFGCFFAYQEIYLARDSNSPSTTIFSVRKGEGIQEISNNLENQGLIKSSLFFQGYVLLRGDRGKLQAGKYELSPAMNIPKIAAKLVFGTTIKEKITIIEGWNLRDVALYFEKEEISSQKEFFELLGYPLADFRKNSNFSGQKDFSEEFNFLKDKPENLNLEGYLFPDTYEINPEDGIKEIIEKALANFSEKLIKDLRKEIASQNKTIFEIVTMASLIEKEAKTFGDKKIVSGVLWKRLKNGIPLQVDATINYITGKKSVKVSKEETKIDSPYNTYKYRGLPLGPICNPGEESFLAAIYPGDSQYWYYLSDTDGIIYFSETLKEHNIKKAKYLK